MMEDERREEEEEEEILEVDVGELMKLYENVTDDESVRKDGIYGGWRTLKTEFFGLLMEVVELYVNYTTPAYLFKRFLKMINRMKQFNQVLEEKAEESLNSSGRKELVLLIPLADAITSPVRRAISYRGEIVQHWVHFSSIMIAFENVLESRIGDEHQKVGNAVWKAYMLVMDEAAYYESELASYLLTTTKLSKPTVGMQAAYVKGGFEEAEEKDDFSTRIKLLKMNERRVVRLKKEIQARRESKKGKKEEEKTEEEKREGVLKRRKELKLIIPKKKMKEAPKIVVDEVEARKMEVLKQQELLTTLFMVSFAAEVEKKIRYLAESDCSGCVEMSLSQIDHDICVMMSSPAKYELYFNKAINLVSFISVFKEWDARVQKEFTPPLSKEEMEAYEIADNPLERFNTIKGSPQELEAFKNYVKIIYPLYK